jgi:hypothetical protein
LEGHAIEWITRPSEINIDHDGLKTNDIAQMAWPSKLNMDNDELFKGMNGVSPQYFP